MGDTTIHLDALPDEVYAHLTTAVDEIEPGPLKVGNQYQVPGTNQICTITVVEPPTRFGWSWLQDDVTVSYEYTILPDRGGSLVRVEMDTRSPSHALTAMIMGGLVEGRDERKLLQSLKTAIEAKPKTS